MQLGLSPHSTRNRPRSIDKEKSTKNLSNKNTANFFKKKSTDENQKNCMNYLEKIVGSNGHTIYMPSGTNNLSKSNNFKKIQKSEKTSNGKPNTLPFAKKKSSILSNKTLQICASTNQLKTPTSVHPSLKLSTGSTFTINSTSGKENTKESLKDKQKSVKNLKLSSSIDFSNKILTKSVSQTTMNKKMDQKKLRILQKLAFNKKVQRFEKSEITSSVGLRSAKNSNQSDKYNGLSISSFSLGKKLGNGRFGSVYLAQEKRTKMICAIKILNKNKVRESGMQQQVVSQIKLQTYMNHPNILKIFGFFHDSKNIYLILQFCSQCLFKDFRNKGRFSEQETAYYVKQAISSLKYMHNESIMHRDIKPQNILVEQGVLKMSDFGWSIYSPIYKRQTFCGTVDYVPPQIVQGSMYDQKIDIWAIGVLLYELSSGMAPFQTKDQNITYQKILKSNCKFPKHFSDKLKGLISWILDKNPANRPNLAQIQSHQWFQDYKTTGRYISKQIWRAWNDL